MELLTLEAVSDYRLLLFQPDPETGERLCVGVAFEDDLLFEIESSRLHCFAKHFPHQILGVYLKEIRDRLTHSGGADLERLMRDYAPTFVFSPPRKLLRIPDQATKLMLLERFVHKGDVRIPTLNVRRSLSAKLRDFASNAVRSEHQIIEDAGPLDIFGERRRGLGRVALAVKIEQHVLLMDGVDLNLLNPQVAIQSSTRVVHTFWQYGRAKRPYGESLRRLAVIFNGRPTETASYRDAHDFIVEQFKKEADETVEASADNSVSILGRLLN
jgi:hypothetical protein